MEFRTTGYTISGDTLSLVDTLTVPIPEIAIGSSISAKISSVIDGDDGLLKSGGGMIVIDSTSAYTGGTGISDGTLRIGDGGTIGTLGGGDVTILSGAGLEFYRTDPSSTWIAIANDIDGSGSMKFRSSGDASKGSYQLTSDNSGFSGTITVDDARLKGTQSYNFGSSSTSINVLDGGQIYVSTGTFSQPLTLGGTGWSEAAGTLGALRLQNHATWAGDITLDATTRITAYHSTGTITGTITGDEILECQYSSPVCHLPHTKDTEPRRSTCHSPPQTFTSTIVVVTRVSVRIPKQNRQHLPLFQRLQPQPPFLKRARTFRFPRNPTHLVLEGSNRIHPRRPT